MSESIQAHQNVDRLEIDGKVIYLVGTAHVSRESVELAEALIHDVKPDAVAIELDEGRYASLQDPERWKRTDIITVIREGRAFILVLQILLAGFQKKLGNLLKVKPGEEMLQAAAAAMACGATLVLADREVKITLKRTWRSITWRTILRLIWSWLHSLFEPHEFRKEDIERLKSPDVLNELMDELAREMPEVRQSLITERDMYLSRKIRSAPGSTVVAVLGAGHIPGIKEWIHKDFDISSLEYLPPRSASSRALRLSVLAIFLVALAWAFVHAGAATGVRILSAWFWMTAIPAGLGALLVLAHPLSIAAAFLSAPFTTFPPLVGAGWAAGIVEAWVRKPQVEDFERLVDDVSSVRGAWHNRVIRILLIMALSNIGAALGAAWGAAIIARILS